MKKLIVLVAMFSFSGVAAASPCPQGANVRLGDQTNPGQSAAAQLLARSGANSQSSRGPVGGATLRNHFPH